MDHQMNLMVSEEFGSYFVRLPLKKSAKIVHGNALRLDWGEILEPEDRRVHSMHLNSVRETHPTTVS